MSRKKSATSFKLEADEITAFTTAARSHFSEQHVSWAHEYGIIRLYAASEALMLDALVKAINNDTAQLAQSTGLSFPKHLIDEVCEFLIVGNGYFNFKGRDGLLKLLRDYVPSNHYLPSAVKKQCYKTPLEQMSALRNYAAHSGNSAKTRAKKVVGQRRMSSAGVWLKTQQRFQQIIDPLKNLADDIYVGAPY